jgi:hypothetical protein
MDLVGKPYSTECRRPQIAATIAGVDAIVSWDFRHIVKLDMIKGYNQVNLINGHGELTIACPREFNVEE